HAIQIHAAIKIDIAAACAGAVDDRVKIFRAGVDLITLRNIDRNNWIRFFEFGWRLRPAFDVPTIGHEQIRDGLAEINASSNKQTRHDVDLTLRWQRSRFPRTFSAATRAPDSDGSVPATRERLRRSP